uniref:Uncharacterized protein n=1 Tax=Branchiostoma floridae TaxID=7739 RepID=C3ZK90_BRAFL|eukprot:XP_002590978.1 hypothetical protein BRAFLDRAFT_69471 [Branchiostoma floridae]
MSSSCCWRRGDSIIGEYNVSGSLKANTSFSWLFGSGRWIGENAGGQVNGRSGDDSQLAGVRGIGSSGDDSQLAGVRGIGSSGDDSQLAGVRGIDSSGDDSQLAGVRGIDSSGDDSQLAGVRGIGSSGDDPQLAGVRGIGSSGDESQLAGVRGIGSSGDDSQLVRGIGCNVDGLDSARERGIGRSGEDSKRTGDVLENLAARGLGPSRRCTKMFRFLLDGTQDGPSSGIARFDRIAQLSSLFDVKVWQLQAPPQSHVSWPLRVESLVSCPEWALF